MTLVALERCKDRGNVASAVQLVAEKAGRADAIFIPDGGEALADAATALAEKDLDLLRFVLLGTQLWDDPKIFSNPMLQGGGHPAPDPDGFRAFADRYRSRYRKEPLHPAALAL
jgi:branched-chain amino acid transport system substrate-binding protein